MGTITTALLKDDLDINIKDSDFSLVSNTLEHDLDIISIGALCDEGAATPALDMADRFTDYCLLCGADRPTDKAARLSRVAREIGALDEQISMLTNERTRLTYVERDIMAEINPWIE